MCLFCPRPQPTRESCPTKQRWLLFILLVQIYKTSALWRLDEQSFHSLITRCSTLNADCVDFWFFLQWNLIILGDVCENGKKWVCRGGKNRVQRAIHRSVLLFLSEDLEVETRSEERERWMKQILHILISFSFILSLHYNPKDSVALLTPLHSHLGWLNTTDELDAMTIKLLKTDLGVKKQNMNTDDLCQWRGDCDFITLIHETNCSPSSDFVLVKPSRCFLGCQVCEIQATSGLFFHEVAYKLRKCQVAFLWAVPSSVAASPGLLPSLLSSHIMLLGVSTVVLWSISV